jgi:hypothetical protein
MYSNESLMKKNEAAQISVMIRLMLEPELLVELGAADGHRDRERESSRTTVLSPPHFTSR